MREAMIALIRRGVEFVFVTSFSDVPFVPLVVVEFRGFDKSVIPGIPRKFPR